MFKTAYCEEVHKRIYCNSGKADKDEYMLRMVNGSDDLVLTGHSSLYDYIQSHADSVDIHKILERCAMANDYSILNRMPASFMDTTEMPKNLAEAYSMVQDAKNLFERMPVEIKQAYDNNYMDFIQSIGSKKFEDVAGAFLNKIKPKENIKEDIKEEVKE